MIQVSQKYYKRAFWESENLKYAQPHFRMDKAARIVNRIARGRNCDLLDVGCGPATLMQLLDANVRYYGIDIAIHTPAPNLIETDFVENPIKFGDKQFDIVIAQGVFEYIGSAQRQKLYEISQLLYDSGKFVISYVNFNHCNKNVYWPYNNIQPFNKFCSSLEEFFHIDRYVPTSHRWHHDEPRGKMMRAMQKYVNVNIPVVSRLFAVEYFCLCSKKHNGQ